MSEVNLVPRHETEHPRRAFLTGPAAAGAAALLVGSGHAFAAPEKESGPVGSPGFSLGQAVILDQLIEAPEGREQVRQS